MPIGPTTTAPNLRMIDPEQPKATPSATIGQKASALPVGERVWIDDAGFLRLSNRRGVV